MFSMVLVFTSFVFLVAFRLTSDFGGGCDVRTSSASLRCGCPRQSPYWTPSRGLVECVRALESVQLAMADNQPVSNSVM